MPRYTRPFIALSVLLFGCAGTPEPPTTQHLIDFLDRTPVEILGTTAPAAPPRARWRIHEPDSDSQSLADWMNGGGVADLEVRDGRLRDDDRHASYALILDGWRLIHNVTGDEGEPEHELYDQQEDP